MHTKSLPKRQKNFLLSNDALQSIELLRKAYGGLSPSAALEVFLRQFTLSAVGRTQWLADEPSV